MTDIYRMCLQGLRGPPEMLLINGEITADEYLDCFGEPRRPWDEELAPKQNKRPKQEQR